MSADVCSRASHFLSALCRNGARSSTCVHCERRHSTLKWFNGITAARKAGSLSALLCWRSAQICVSFRSWLMSTDLRARTSSRKAPSSQYSESGVLWETLGDVRSSCPSQRMVFCSVEYFCSSSPEGNVVDHACFIRFLIRIRISCLYSIAVVYAGVSRDRCVHEIVPSVRAGAASRRVTSSE